MTEVYSNLSQWLGEDPKRTEPALLFNQILDFLATVNTAKEKVRKRLERKKKQLLQRKQEVVQIHKKNGQKQRYPQNMFSSKSDTSSIKSKTRRYSVDAWAEEDD